MGKPESYKAYETKRASALLIVVVLAAALAGVLASQVSPPASAAQLRSNVTAIWLGLVALLLAGSFMLWRFSRRERELLETFPPQGPEPPPMASYRYVKRRDRPAFLRTAAVAIAISAGVLLYLAWRVEGILSR